MDQEGVEIESKTKNVTHPLGNLNYKELRDLTRREISNFLVSKKDPNRSSLMGSRISNYLFTMINFISK